MSSLPLRLNTEGYFTDGKNVVAAINKKGILWFPGGGIDDDETPEKAMVREAMEEMGATVSDLKPAGRLEIIWEKEWASVERKTRKKQYRGDDMHFFTGKLVRLETPTGEGAFTGKRLMPIADAIAHIENHRPFEKGVHEYREMQKTILQLLLSRANHPKSEGF